MKKKHLQLAALFLAAGLAAVAQDPPSRVYRRGGQWIEETTGTLTAGKLVRVKTTGGAITVTGGPQNAITYTVRKHVRAGSEEAARKEFPRLRVTAGIAGESVLLQGEGENHSNGTIDFEVVVPAQTSTLKLETSGGTVSANNVSGRVDANTGGGSMQLDGIGGGVTASSGGGNIEIGKVGGDINVQTGGGTIHIISAGGRIVASSGGGMLTIGVGKGMKLNTGGGSIQVNQCNGEIKASTGGGKIELNQVSGTLQADSGGGAIHVGPVRGGVRVETGSGSIVADLSASGGPAFTDSRLETAAGDIIVYIPDDLAVTIRATTDVATGVGIRSDFPGLKISSEKWSRETFAEGALNGGGPLLHIHTTTGSIELRRKNKQ